MLSRPIKTRVIAYLCPGESREGPEELRLNDKWDVDILHSSIDTQKYGGDRPDQSAFDMSQ